MSDEPTTGLVLGKFMPPTLGHCHLVRFGQEYVDRLSVMVCSLPDDPIDPELRFGWMREMFAATSEVVHHDRPIPQAPEEHPEFWRIWREAIWRTISPDRLDFVFASEAYGDRLARELGARFVPVDLGRRAVPISATEVRADPMGHWEMLPSCVRPYYARRVVILDDDQALAPDVARALGTVCVLPRTHGTIEERARALRADRRALARQARCALVMSGDVLTLQIASAGLAALGLDEPAQLYLVGAVTAQRERLIRGFEEAGVAHRALAGDGASRRRQAIALVEALVGRRLAGGPTAT